MFGIEAVKYRVSQTFLNYFDIYSVIDQQALVDQKKRQDEGPLNLMGSAREGTFVLNFEEVPPQSAPQGEQIGLLIEETERTDLGAAFPSFNLSPSRAQSIVVTTESFQHMPTISKCLPEVKPVSSEPSQILSQGKMHVLSYHLPSTIRLNKWELLFTTRRDGYSNLTFFSKLEDMTETILVIKDSQGYVFGALTTEEWQNRNGFYGDGYSFVFTFKDGDDLQLYPATGECEFYQHSDEDGIIIGGSDQPKERASLSIGDKYSRGFSGQTYTYNNEQLCSSPPKASSHQEGDFIID